MIHKTSIDGAIMVDGMGIQGVPPVECVAAANDNGTNAATVWPLGNLHRPMTGHDDLVETTFAPLERMQPRSVPPRQPVIHDGDGYLPRLGDFMQTYTGRKFWPMDPRADEIDIRDIAHSLAMQCRYAGHCKRFYSVAEHSTLIARWLVGRNGAETALWGLLHDASEAYLVDVPRPVKPYLTGYKDAEALVMRRVCDRFGLAREMPAAVHAADERILADELVNLVRMDWHANHDNPLGVPMMYWSPAEAEVEFMATFDALWEQVAIARAAQTLEVA